MRSLLAVVAAFALCTNEAFPQEGRQGRAPKPADFDKKYDGTWWLARSSQQRSGFLEGSGDCLTWVARLRGFGDPSDELVEKVTHYYRTHPSNKGTPVIEVWRQLAGAEIVKEYKEGEVWRNPHWYLNGLWWRQSSEEARLGFLEGYLWCVKSCVSPRSGAYTLSASSYRSKIDDYVKKHAKADDEAIATILGTFRDMPKER